MEIQHLFFLGLNERRVGTVTYKGNLIESFWCCCCGAQGSCTGLFLLITTLALTEQGAQANAHIISTSHTQKTSDIIDADKKLKV